MWSVWSEPVEIYLGQGIAMLKTRHKEVHVMQYPATLPQARVMLKLTEALAQDSEAHKPKHRNLRITLSGAFCPAMGFTAPVEVARWHELRQIASATAAASLGTSTDQIVCETDADRPGIAAAVAGVFMAEIQRWAISQNCRIASIRPLWAVATQSQVARQSAVQGLLMQETDSVTMVADGGNGKSIASTLVHEYDQASRPANVRRWLASLGLSEDKLLKLSFDTQSHGIMRGSPKTWPAHWIHHREEP